LKEAPFKRVVGDRKKGAGKDPSWAETNHAPQAEPSLLMCGVENPNNSPGLLHQKKSHIPIPRAAVREYDHDWGPADAHGVGQRVGTWGIGTFAGERKGWRPTGNEEIRVKGDS